MESLEAAGCCGHEHAHEGSRHAYGKKAHSCRKHLHDHEHDGHACEHDYSHEHEHAHGHAHEHDECCCHDHSAGPDIGCCGHDHDHDHGGQMSLRRIITAAAIFAAALVLHLAGPTGFMESAAGTAVLYAVCIVAYLMVGWPVLKGAAKNIAHRELLDEAFLMAIATIAAFCIGEVVEAVAVMLFFQVGEWFQDRAVDKSKDSISSLVEIKAKFANVERGGVVAKVDPSTVATGETIVVNPGERVPLDGVIVEGASELDTSALTGESMPSEVEAGDEVLSGCINGSRVLRVKVTRPFEDCAVSRILDMVGNAASKKARTETFIRRFSHVYTPIVVIAALIIAIVPPLVIDVGDASVWKDFIERACTFLVISCPCALVISVPLSFYCGIGALSWRGVLAKGGNYLEQLAKVDTVVFDKTGTLTQGRFHVVEVHPAKGISEEKLLELAAHVERNSTHPIAQSICSAYGECHDSAPMLNLPEHHDELEEVLGHGIVAQCPEGRICAGNEKLMRREGVEMEPCDESGTFIHVSLDGVYQGHLVIADEEKPQAAQAVSALKAMGVTDTVMLTGDKAEVAQSVAEKLGITRYFSQLLPADKVERVEELMEAKKGLGNSTLAFVGDGINDAPVLTRADVGIAMGAMGSDAAIEASDIVLMDDNPARIADAVRISRKTVANARQNVVFAIAVKALVFVLGALGIATMWMAVFADTGVAILCVLNAIRILRTK